MEEKFLEFQNLNFCEYENIFLCKILFSLEFEISLALKSILRFQIWLEFQLSFNC